MPEQEIFRELRELSQKVDRLLHVMESIQTEQRSKKTSKNPRPKPASITQDDINQYQAHFTRLYEKWLSGDELGVQDDLDKFDAEEIRRFADSNDLNVTSKMSKERVLQLVGARFREKRQLHHVRPPRIDITDPSPSAPTEEEKSNA